VLSINDCAPPKSNAPDKSPTLRSKIQQNIEEKKGLPLRAWLINKPIVEIESINQLKQIIDLKFKRVLFDNMNINELKRCLKLCKNKYQTEYSGNATLKNIKQLSKTGVNRISVGVITHSAKSFDTTLLFR